MDKRANFSSSSGCGLSFHPNLTAWTEAATSYVFHPRCGLSRLNRDTGSMVCETILLAFILWKRFQLLMVSVPSEWNSSGEDRPHLKEETSHISFVTWSIKELNSNIICTFSLTEVRLPVDTMSECEYSLGIVSSWNAHNNQLCYSQEVAQPAFVREMK